MSGGAPRNSDGPRGGGLQLVAVSNSASVPASTSAVGPARTAAGGGEGAIVEYRPVLREEEEDLEVKLRRIIENVPVRVSNTSGSSAGSGSGDFHQYRQMRRKEQDRLSRMDADYQRRKETAEFSMRREERLKAAGERTAKKRLKRQKKKQKKKEKKSKTSGDGEEDGEENHKDESSDNEDSDYNDDECEMYIQT